MLALLLFLHFYAKRRQILENNFIFKECMSLDLIENIIVFGFLHISLLKISHILKSLLVHIYSLKNLAFLWRSWDLQEPFIFFLPSTENSLLIYCFCNVIWVRFYFIILCCRQFSLVFWFSKGVEKHRGTSSVFINPTCTVSLNKYEIPKGFSW